jgi:homoserine kinase type II
VWARRHFDLSSVETLSPIAEGIENTNYFMETSNQRFVFTIFEVWDTTLVAYYSAFVRHLAAAGVPVPAPLTPSDDAGLCWEDKPCLITPFVEGDWIANPSVADCHRMGVVVAKLHAAAAGFGPSVTNPRGADWRRKIAPLVRDKLSSDKQALLDEALACDARFSQLPLPSGACHCDLFRNNVLWRSGAIVGVIDFYFGGCDSLIFDLAVCICDWCANPKTGVFDEEKFSALLAGYEENRVLCALEKVSFNEALALAALRFWMSRLYDWHFPRHAQCLTPHDPEHFERVLLQAQRQYPPYPKRKTG